MREFAINLLYYFSGADSGVARTVAQQDTCVSLLIGFIEQVIYLSIYIIHISIYIFYICIYDKMAIARNTPFTLSKIDMLELKEELCLVYSMVRQK